MLTLLYENDKNQTILLGNERPYFFLSQQGADGVAASAFLTKAPYQQGKTALGTGIDERLITIRGALVTEDTTEYERHRRALIQAFNPLLTGRLTAYGTTFSRRFENVCVVDAPSFLDTDYESPDGIVHFTVTLMVPGNYATDIDWEKVDMMEVEPKFSFVLAFDKPLLFGDMTGGKAIINNNGDAPASLVITIPGPVDTPSITNLTTGAFIKVNTPIYVHQKMMIKTGFGEKSVTIYDENGESFNAFHYIDLESTFFQLELGENVLRFQAEEGNDTAAIGLQYKRLYAGI